MNQIPKQKKLKFDKLPAQNKHDFSSISNGIVFSFEILQRTEYFNIDASCDNWSSELFDMMKDVSTHTMKELVSNKFKKYRVHHHEGVTPPSPLPPGVDLKDCYQIRIYKSKGGIHGVFRENVFYVIWLDPLHNLYPSDKYGGLRIIKPTKTRCIDELENQIQDLIEKNSELKKQNEVYEALFEEEAIIQKN